MFFAATGSKSNMLMASFGDAISLSILRGAQIMGSGSRDGVSAAMAARSDAARSGLAARNCRNLRRLVAWASIGIGDPPCGPPYRPALEPGRAAPAAILPRLPRQTNPRTTHALQRRTAKKADKWRAPDTRRRAPLSGTHATGVASFASCPWSHETEGSMNSQLRDFLLMATLAGVTGTPAFGQSVAPAI